MRLAGRFIPRETILAAVPSYEVVESYPDDEYVEDDNVRVVTSRLRLSTAVRPLVPSHHPEFLDLIARSRAEVAAGQTISLDEMKRRLLPKRSPNERMPPTARKTRRG